MFDPGVLIAGSISATGAPRVLLELERVLLRPKFRAYVTALEVRASVALLRRLATIVGDPPFIVGLTPDLGDDYLVVLAHASGVQTLVSSDRHLRELADPVPPVLTPRELLDHLASYAQRLPRRRKIGSRRVSRPGILIP